MESGTLGSSAGTEGSNGAAGAETLEVLNPATGETIARLPIDSPEAVAKTVARVRAAPPDWEASFVDYFYLSFTNATAFSPTDTLPMTAWAKLTMFAQSAVSLSTVALVIARAVNILK